MGRGYFKSKIESVFPVDLIFLFQDIQDTSLKTLEQKQKDSIFYMWQLISPFPKIYEQILYGILHDIRGNILYTKIAQCFKISIVNPDKSPLFPIFERLP